MAKGRKTHIARIYKNDDRDSNTWVDIERIDELHVIVAGQRIHYTFDWERVESGTIGLSKKTLVNPNDESNKIDVPIRDKHRIKFPQAVYNHYFLNDGTNKSRETHSRRVYNHAIKEAYLVDNEPPRDPKIYQDALGEQDPEQYIDVEVIDAYWTKGDDSRDVFQHILRLFLGGTFGDKTVTQQKKEWSGATADPLIKDPLKEGDVEGGTPAFIPIKNPGAGEVDPPWRLDPLQNIVNIQWSPGPFFVIATKNNVYYYDPKEQKFETGELAIPGFPGTQGKIIGLDVVETADKTSLFALAGNTLMPDPLSMASPPVMLPEFYIATSTDGKNWSVDYRSPYESGFLPGEPGSPGTRESFSRSVSAIVADGSQFALSGMTQKYNDDHGTSGFHSYETIYRGSGGSFSQVDETFIDDLYKNESSFPDRYCHKNAKCKDDFFHSVPGGIMQASDELTLRPDNPPTVYYITSLSSGIIDYHTLPRLDPYGQGPRGSIGNNRIHSEQNKEFKEISVPDIAVITAIAGKSGVWMAGGFEGNNEDSKGVAAISTDSGETWTLVGDTDTGIIGIVAGKVAKG
jgi:hypothetical protein